ncbi:MAG: phage tail sheath subtilisin-like domain-containing protein [Aquiluna sp.]
MAITGFFHGVETRYQDTVPRSVQVVPSAVIFLVGTAPTYKATNTVAINDPIRCQNDVEDVDNFGAKTTGFTIPYALDVLRDYGAGTVEVVNVWDPATHKTTGTAIEYTLPTTGTSADIIQLLRVTGTAPTQTKTTINAEGLTGTTTVTDSGAITTYVENTDYTLDETTGTITRLSTGSISAGETLEVTYTYADPDTVDAAAIIGTVVAGDRTGLQAALDVYPLRGYKPKILIAPEYSDQDSVAVELIAKADALKAYTGIDAAAGATRDEAVAGRNGTAPVANFDTSNRRAVLCYPRMTNSDGVSLPASIHFAGVVAYTDLEFGYWWSPSNKEIKNATEAELRLTADFTDATSDLNVLNAAGIWSPAYRSFGTGYRAWGNRSARFPSDSDVLTFICIGRNLDITLESAQNACLPFVDRPINDALIDVVLETLNGFVRERVLEGAMFEGSEFFYSPARNPATQLAAGKIVFSYRFGMPTPAEWIILEGTIDVNLFNQLGQSLEAV